MKKHHVAVAAISLISTLLLTGCSEMTTPASAQKTANNEFKTLQATITKADTLTVKNHQGRAYIPGSCQGDQVQFTDTSAVYVPKNFDQNAYLKKLQTTLSSKGYQTSLGTSSGYQVLTFSKNNYDYQALATTKVKDTTINTNKAILFTIASPCLTNKA